MSDSGHVPTAARDGTTWADLVLEGGGVKGIGLVGAISVLEEAGYRFRRVAGTSAGSIVGALVAAGMSAQQMLEVMEGLDYRRFEDAAGIGRIPIVGRYASLLWDEGMHPGNYLRSFVADQLAGCGVTTYGDLREADPDSSLPPHQRYKLIAHASDISRARLLRLPWDYGPWFGLDPDTQVVADSIRASASIPFFFQPTKLAPATGDPSWLVDGGMLSNFPIDVFDRTDGEPPRWPTIGIKLSARRPAGQVLHEVDDVVSLTEAMIGTLTSWFDLERAGQPGVADRTIFVDTTGVKSTDFDIDEATQQRLHRNGREAAAAWLSRASGASPTPS